MRNVRCWLEQHPVASYFALALTISWLIALPLALSAQHVLPLAMPMWLHYLASLGPLLAALIVTAALGGRSGVTSLLATLVRWRIGWRWWTVAAAPVGLFAVASVVARFVEGTWPDLLGLGNVSFLGDIGVPAALLLWLATFGFGEETGWRGFALPQLQRRHSSASATAVIAAIWAVWHAPYWFYMPGYQRLGAAGVPGFVIGLLVGAILLTWVYNGSGGSVPAVAAWHALFDLFSGSQATDGLMNGVMSTVMLVWAVGILVVAARAQRTGAHANSPREGTRREPVGVGATSAPPLVRRSDSRV